MPSCVLRYCKSRYGITPERNYSLFSFPQDINTRKKWIQVVRLERREENWLPSAASKLCSKHFRKEDIYFGRTGRPILKRVSVPYEFGPSTNNHREEPPLYRASTLEYQEEDDCILNASTSSYSTSSRFLRMCRVCLATNCKFYSLTRFKNLDKAYKLLTGISTKNEIDLPPFLCNVCAHRLLNSIHFRSQSIRAHSMLLEAVNKHDEMKKLVTLESIKSIIGEQRLGMNLGIRHNPTDYYDLDIEHVPSENENVQVEHIQIKMENDDNVDSDENAAETPMYYNLLDCYVKNEEEGTDDEGNKNDTRNIMTSIKIEKKADESNFHKVSVVYETNNPDITGENVINNNAVSTNMQTETAVRDYTRRKNMIVEKQDNLNDEIKSNDDKFYNYIPGWHEQIADKHVESTSNDSMIYGTSSSIVKR